MLIACVRMAFRELAANLLRTSLTTIGIVIGVTSYDHRVQVRQWSGSKQIGFLASIPSDDQFAPGARDADV